MAVLMQVYTYHSTACVEVKAYLLPFPPKGQLHGTAKRPLPGL